MGAGMTQCPGHDRAVWISNALLVAVRRNLKGTNMTRAIDVVRKMATDAMPNYIRAFENGDGLLKQHEVDTPDRLAHFLAQVLHESDGLTIEWENMNYRAERLVQMFGHGVHSARVTLDEAQKLDRNGCAIAERVFGLGNPAKARELGNVHPGDGFRYRGGGLMQTTGRANYRRMGKLCRATFEEVPELIVSAEHALKPALCEWTEGKLNAFADCNDILAISRAINLGNPRAERQPNGLQSRSSGLRRSSL
jgi:putative chitinase